MDDFPATELSKMADRIHALQHGYTSRRNEKEIARLILSVDGMELTRLKNLIDQGGDHCDLLELVYSDIDDRDLRMEILNHFKTRSGEFLKPPLRVLSDVDDTLYASLHDKRFPNGTLYPGVVSLHEELQRATVADDSPIAALVLLTARPRDKMGVVERWTQRQMHRKGLPEMTVLSGTLFDLRSHTAMAKRKLRNFQMYQELYPEYRFVFFGDSGQGDSQLGTMMLDRFPTRIETVLIHQVNAKRLAPNLVAFSTYFEAATELHKRGLLEASACRRIYQKSLERLSKIRFRSEHQKQLAFNALAESFSKTTTEP